MAGDLRFTFVSLPKKVSQTLTSKDNQENLLRWGLKGHLRVNFYNFNQNFRLHDTQDFVEAFFKDPNVYTTLKVSSSSGNLAPIGFSAEKVDYQPVSCTETSMKFFDKLQNEENGIVRSGYLTECLEEFVDGMLLQDNLRQMLVMEDHTSHNLYDGSEKKQFLFLIFKHLALGGFYCQRSPTLQPYLDVTKSLYKELISVEKLESTNQLRVRSVVIKVVAYSQQNTPIAPLDPEHPQNFIYLCVDPVKRQLAVFYHNFGGYVIE